MNIDPGWQRILREQFESPYFSKLAEFVRKAYAGGVVYPPERLIFEAFNRTPFERVKVVMFGQDPYHNPHQAHGLCFSVPPDADVPPSLVNIYKELEAEYGPRFLTRNGDLSHWADQGVLMLNATLTVGAGHPGSHQGKGWETFTDAVVAALAERRKDLVFMLWGSYARRKGAQIDRSKHLVLESAHPSPLSAYRGFFGCNHFRLANDWLEAHGEAPIKW